MAQLSSGLATEVRSKGVIIQSTTPAFVCSNMSKYKSPRLFVPSAEQFVRAQLRTVGLKTETFGCPSHEIQVSRGAGSDGSSKVAVWCEVMWLEVMFG